MPWEDLLSKDIELLETGELSDATITCGDTTWNVHKSIISRCEWFKKALSGNFQEAWTNNVDIHADDFSPDLVDAVIRFIYSGAVDVEKLNTNDSLVDACVRVWVIADFLVLKELQTEAIKLLEEHFDEKMKVMCVMDANDEPAADMALLDFNTFLDQTFAGITTAFTTYPHSSPCQDVLVSFFHAIRAAVFGSKDFSLFMAHAPHEFSHELLMATLDGKQSKWVHDGEGSEYRRLERNDECTGCGCPNDIPQTRWAVNPRFSGSNLVFWRCISCHKEKGSQAA